MRFTSGQFTATKFGTAEDKARLANHFVRFVESGYDAKLFKKWFYQRLSNMFGHIAHYDISGFFNCFFTTPEGQLAFAEITESCPGYGDPAFTDSDVENVLRKWAMEYGMFKKAKAKLDTMTEKAERSELSRLMAKYPIAIA